MTRPRVVGLALALGFAVGAALHHLAGAAVAHRVGLFALCAAVSFQAVSVLLQQREHQRAQELKRWETELQEGLRLDEQLARQIALEIEDEGGEWGEYERARAARGRRRRAPWPRVYDANAGRWVRWNGRRWVSDAGGDHGQH